MAAPDLIASAVRTVLGHATLSPFDLPSQVAEPLVFSNIRALQSSADQFLSGFRKAATPHRPQVSVVVVPSADPRPNAYALSGMEPSVVVFTVGFFLRVRQMYHFVAYNCDLFPEQRGEKFLGDPEALLGGLTTAVLLQPADLRANPLGSDTDERYAHLMTPIAPTQQRFELAQRMTGHALAFVVMHELAHILRGHSQFSSTPVDQVSAFGESGYVVSAREAAARPMMEIDADVLAAKVTSGLSSQAFSKNWGGWAATTDEALELWTMTISLMWTLLGTWDSYPHTQVSGHPHALVRTIVSTLHMQGVPDHKRQAIAAAGLRRALTAWQRMQMPSIPQSPDYGASVVAASRALYAEYQRVWLPLFEASKRY